MTEPGPPASRLRARAAGADDRAGSARTAGGADPLRVLLVEDQPEDAALLLLELRRSGFAAEGQRVDSEAGLVAALPWRPDVILADYSLPQLDALRVIELVQAQAADIPVVVVSGSISEEVAVDCMRRGAADYLLKDRLARLGQAVGQAMAARRLREERRRAEEALRESEERFRSAFEDSATGMSIQALDGHYLRVNRVLCDMLGYPDDELLGLTYLDVVHPADRQFDVDQDRRMLAGEIRSYQSEKRYFHKQGQTIWALTSASLVRAPDGRPLHFIAQCQDVTERKRAEEVRQALEGQLRQSQKMDVLGQLAGGIAHDFNNLLAVILGYSETMASTLHESDPLREDADEIRRAAERAAALTRQLLIFSRRQLVERRPLELDVLVAPLATMLRRLIGEDLELHTRLGAPGARVRAEPSQIEQVLVNLAVNARDAMAGGGGRLEVETATVEVDASLAARQPGLAPGTYLVLRVRDTGRGMTPEVQARIFEPFFTTKAEGKGTGLGLATVYGIVQQHQGVILVESAPGRGSTFSIYLPREEEAGDAPVSPASPASGAEGETILLVEDDPGVRRVVRTLLERHGYDVLEADAPEDAVHIAETHPGRIDLVLSDVVMPQMSGSQLAARLDAARPGLGVLYMSGHIAPSGEDRTGSGPVAEVLEKPFSAEELGRALRQALARPRGAGA